MLYYNKIIYFCHILQHLKQFTGKSLFISFLKELTARISESSPSHVAGIKSLIYSPVMVYCQGLQEWLRSLFNQICKTMFSWKMVYSCFWQHHLHALRNSKYKIPQFYCPPFVKFRLLSGRPSFKRFYSLHILIIVWTPSQFSLKNLKINGRIFTLHLTFMNPRWIHS